MGSGLDTNKMQIVFIFNNAWERQVADQKRCWNVRIVHTISLISNGGDKSKDIVTCKSLV